MLYALNTEGKLQSLYQMSKQEISAIKRQMFRCPTCNEPLQVRAGLKVIPHFSHPPKSDCASIKKGESLEHETGKWALYEWLFEQGYEVHLEPYIEEIQQRADVLMKHNGKKLALEYQCSTIPIREVRKRTAAYKKIEVFPLWILGMKHFQRSGPEQILLNDFIRSFLYYWHNSYHLLFFDTSSKRIIRVSHIRSIGMRQNYGSIHSTPISEALFPQFLSPDNSSDTLNLFFDLKQKWFENRTVYRKQVGSEERKYRQYLYLNGYHFSLIPSVCFLPLAGQVQLMTKPYIWQTRLLIDHFISLPIGAFISFPEIKIQSTINGYTPSLSTQYLNLLAKLNIVGKTGNNTWVKKKQVSFHKRMEDGLEDDRRTLAQLKSLQRIKI
ncbi:competence protein CoiA [Halobacillus sp. H74]|uniref:competence protein CoiA n=1 Tax=Halobacillus sp. H74 TaxID=3457436 RepID=UPI003FCCF9FF